MLYKTVFAVTAWVLIDLLIFWFLGIYSSTSFHIGWSSSLLFFNIPIDTPAKYFALLGYIIVNSAIMNLALVNISTWLISEVQNIHHHQIRQPILFIFYTLFIWNSYLWIDGIVGVRVQLSQIDLWLALWLTNILSQVVTIALILKTKRKYVPWAPLLSQA